MNYYNEIDPYAAQWLRNLIAAGHIANGVVDERDIRDVCPDELMGYTQCHFFAGIGVWSHAIRAAGWPDDRPVWTGSCPCQPFSTAGRGKGFADERHLWPSWYHLIRQCRPSVIFGEQVASKAVEPWIDLVHADLEGMGYAFGCAPFPSAGVGAPHIRDRTYWVGSLGVAQGDTKYKGLEGHRWHGQEWHEPGRHYTNQDGSVGAASSFSILADTNGLRQAGIGGSWESRTIECGEAGSGPVNGFWRDADWLGCTDGRYRPVRPGSFPLVASTPALLGPLRANWHAPAGKEGQGHRTGRLKGYGNAINSQAARIFIECVMGNKD